LGVISFHSLEDRIVKNLFKGAATPPPGFRKGRDQFVPMMRTLTKKPLVPSLSEMRSNPRSRSAKMRFAERV
jgi:16S rRNA (cytosine1402-N4)-methyltransferase